MHGNVGQDLAVQLVAGLLQAIDQLRIAKVVKLSCGRDAHDPQRAELALLLFATRVSELQATLYGLLRCLVELRFCEEVAACSLENLLPAVTPLGTTFYAGHWSSPFCVRLSCGWRQEALPGRESGKPLHSLIQASISRACRTAWLSRLPGAGATLSPWP